MVNNSIAQYQITKPLGRGGMAEVFEAVDTKSQQNIALKLLLPHLAAEDVIRRRFLREARVCMELNHPGIVKVFEVGEAEGRPYMAMELVRGQTLEDLLKNKRFDLEQSIGIGLKITDALAAAHAKRIVHRDIKPRNIMVTDTGIKIMDFGLARILETSSITDQHEIIGTLYYMSPEQAIGVKVDESSDVFSLGVVLYQMLTGQLPFAGEHPGAVIHAILYSDPLRINELSKSVPLELEQVIFKTLKKKSQLRYRTAADLHSDLSKMYDVIEGKQIQLLATEEVFEELPRGIYSQLVGRENEMAALEAALEKMIRGESLFFLLSGEAGIGKSRLVWELGRKAKAKQVRYLLGRCLFGDRGYPYQPIIEVLRDYFVFKGIKDPDAVDAFIEEKAKHLSARKEIIQSLLRFQVGTPVCLINKEQLWDTVSELVKVIAQDRPIVLHLDDLHWADAPTLNLLAYLSTTTRQEPIFIVGTYRPEELIAEGGKRHPLQTTLDMLGKENLYHEIILYRLDKIRTQDVVNSVFKDAQFPDNFYDTIYKETEGNPLFVLEVLRSFQDEGIVDKDKTGWHLTSELTNISIPDRVTDVIMNRLRKLSQEDKTVIEIAAVEGYTFQADTICHVLEIPRRSVIRCLQGLESQHHLIHAAEREYEFDHRKIQETIYANLPHELRQEYHRIVADYHVRRYGDRSEFATKIAHHLTAAGLKKESLPYLVKSGQHAQNLFANEEALEKLNSAIKLVDELSRENLTTDLQRTKLEILKSKAEVYMIIDGYDEALANYQRVVEISNQLDDKKELAHGMCGIGTSCISKSKYNEGINWCSRALEIQQEINDERGAAGSLTNIGLAHWQCGYLDKALERFNQALEIADRTDNKILKAGSLKRIGTIHHILADYQISRDYAKKALDIFAGSTYRNDEAECLHLIALNETFLGKYDEALENAEKGIIVSKQIGNKFYEAWCYLDVAFAYRGLGKYVKAVDLCRLSFNIFTKIGSVWGQSRALAFETWILYEFDDYRNLLAVGRKGLDLCQKIGDKTIEPSFIALIAYAYAGLNQHKIALSYFNQIEKTVKEQPIVKTSYIYPFFKFWLQVGDVIKLREICAEIEHMDKKTGSHVIHIDCLTAKARLLLLENSFSNANLYAQDALNFARKTKHARGTAENLILLANIAYQQNRYDTAENMALEALKFVESTQRSKDIGELHLMLARILFHERRIVEATYHAKKVLQIAESYDLKSFLWEAYHMLAKVYLKQKKMKQGKDEMVKAQEVLDIIINNLGDELKEIYLKRKEVKEFKKDLRSINHKSKRGKKK